MTHQPETGTVPLKTTGSRLEAKRCLIVGGTSGIGLAAAKAFLREGATLVIAGLEDERMAHAAQELRTLGSPHFHSCNVTDALEVDTLFQKALEWMGGLDVCYHVAGCSGRKWGDGPLHECTEAGWDATVAANLKGVFLSNRAAVRYFLQAGHPGAILNMASILALAPSPTHFGTCAYTAAKGAIVSLSRLTASCYAGNRIRVNVLAPGLIATPMAQRALDDREVQLFLRSKQPLGPGPGEPIDCAEAAVFLCSDEARFITGTVLPVDGGWSVCDGLASSAGLNLQSRQ
jgi:NAD(P)-dependent dehydrogenase (short-subunit alcohol dehydrogenase family)